jgi:hypothetical protein
MMHMSRLVIHTQVINLHCKINKKEVRRIARTVSFLGITGKLQAEDGVVHLVAEKLWEPRLQLKPTAAPSRDFH